MKLKARAAITVLAAAVFSAVGVTVAAASAAAQTSQDAPAISVTCSEPDDDGIAACSVTSSESFTGDEQIQFSASLPDSSGVSGTTGTTGATGLRPVWCSGPSTADSFCYSFSLETGGQATSAAPYSDGQTVGESTGGIPSSTQVVTVDNQSPGGSNGVVIPGTAPCPQQPELTCLAQPSGPNVVTIHVIDPGDGGSPKVTIDKDGETTEHETTGYHRSQEDAETTQTWQDSVDDATDSDDLAVMWASNGNDSEEEALNKRRLEDELYNAGKPYVVCFEDITVPRTMPDGTVQEVTVPGGDCIVVTPSTP